MATPRAKAAARVDAPAPQPAAATAAPVAREPVRQTMPVIPGRVVFYNRAGKPIQRAGAETGANEFWIPAHLPPPGWSWEWKEETILGEIRSGVAAKQAQVGWEPVMAESYPGELMPEFDDRGAPVKGPVRRGGLILKERRIEATLEAAADDKRKADEAVGKSKRQYAAGPNTDGTQTAAFDKTAQQATYIRQRVEMDTGPTDGPARQPID